MNGCLLLQEIRLKFFHALLLHDLRNIFGTQFYFRSIHWTLTKVIACYALFHRHGRKGARIGSHHKGGVRKMSDRETTNPLKGRVIICIFVCYQMGLACRLAWIQSCGEQDKYLKNSSSPQSMSMSEPSVDQAPWIYRTKRLSRYTLLYIFKAAFAIEPSPDSVIVARLHSKWRNLYLV